MRREGGIDRDLVDTTSNYVVPASAEPRLIFSSERAKVQRAAVMGNHAILDGTTAARDVCSRFALLRMRPRRVNVSVTTWKAWKHNTVTQITFAFFIRTLAKGKEYDIIYLVNY